MYIDYLENIPSFTELKAKILPQNLKVLSSKQLKNDQQFTMVYEKQQKNDSRIYLLFWSHYFGGQDWGHDVATMEEDYFKKLGCPDTNCVMTHKIDLLPHIYDFDAVIFNIWDEDFSLPKLRSPNQLYIMISNE